jgi:hypothetical protein
VDSAKWKKLPHKTTFHHNSSFPVSYITHAKGLARRKAAFAKYGLPNELGTANVSKNRPLQVGRDAPHTIGDTSGGCGYGFVLFGGKIMLARGPF